MNYARFTTEELFKLRDDYLDQIAYISDKIEALSIRYKRGDDIDKRVIGIRIRSLEDEKESLRAYLAQINKEISRRNCPEVQK